MTQKKFSHAPAAKTRNPVRHQYEDYPYPFRDPKDEKKRLITGAPGHLVEMNHYLFAGRRDFTRPFRVLVAGGGTGDGLIMLAQTLDDLKCPAEIHYIDLSRASRKIAEKRARIRNLDRITFHSGSLLEIDHLGLFDYIDCCGVLHHLPEPQQGFQALAAALAPGGGMGVMVYGTLGRTGVYPAQEMLAMIGQGEKNQTRLDMARALLSELPSTNWFARNDALHDHQDNDAGLFDLLLHSQDRSYTVRELAEECTAAGLKIASFIDPARYDPDFYITDKKLQNRLNKQDLVSRAYFAELLAGNIRKHIVYLTRAERRENSVARFDHPQAIPCFLDRRTVREFQNMPPGAQPRFTLDGICFEPDLPPQSAAILRLIDGRRNLEQIRRALPGAPDWFVFSEVFSRLFKCLNGFSRLFIRYPVL